MPGPQRLLEVALQVVGILVFIKIDQTIRPEVDRVWTSGIASIVLVGILDLYR